MVEIKALEAAIIEASQNSEITYIQMLDALVQLDKVDLILTTKNK